MVEFAIVLPVLLLVVLGIMQFGVVYNNWVTLTDATRAGARQAAVSRGLSDPERHDGQQDQDFGFEPRPDEAHGHGHPGQRGLGSREQTPRSRRRTPTTSTSWESSSPPGTSPRPRPSESSEEVTVVIRLLRRGRKLRDERGQVFVLFGIAGIAMLAMVGFVVDAGSVYTGHRRAAGGGRRTASALCRSALRTCKDGTIDADGGRERSQDLQRRVGPEERRLRATGVTTTFTPKCITVNGPCPRGATPAARRTRSSSPSPARVEHHLREGVGINNFSVIGQGDRSMGGGKPIPAHIIIVLDRTGSMGQSCSSGGTKMSCAKAGINSFLLGMDPAYDKVGLASPAADVEQRRLRQPEDVRRRTERLRHLSEQLPDRRTFERLQDVVVVDHAQRGVDARLRRQLRQGGRHDRPMRRRSTRPRQRCSPTTTPRLRT